MRNRLVLKTVEDWKKLHPGQAHKKRKSIKGMSKTGPKHRALSEKEKAVIMSEYMPLPVSDEEEKREKWKIGKDEVTHRISRSLYHFHRIYSRRIKELMVQICICLISNPAGHTNKP